MRRRLAGERVKRLNLSAVFDDSHAAHIIEEATIDPHIRSGMDDQLAEEETAPREYFVAVHKKRLQLFLLRCNIEPYRICFGDRKTSPS